MNAAYQTLIVKFSEPIKVLDGIFDDAEAWGVDTLKGCTPDKATAIPPTSMTSLRSRAMRIT